MTVNAVPAGAREARGGRRQAAPGIKVTSKAFGVGRRIPIAQRYQEL